MEKRKVVCIECGEAAPRLLKIYNSDIIKLSYCDHCNKLVDKYVEFDPVIILLDVLLFKPQAYRHILFNMQIQFQWKLCVISLLCGAYLKWAFNHNTSSENTKDGFAGSFLHYALQIEFYIVFLLAAIDLAAYLGGIHLGCKIYARTTEKPVNERLPILHNAIVLSQAGKLLVIPAVIWGQSHILTSFWLTELFVFTFVSQSLRVTLNCSRSTVALLLLAGYLTEISVSQSAQILQEFLTDR